MVEQGAGGDCKAPQGSAANLQQRLKIGKPVGQGAYAMVYKATLDGRTVALKVLLPRHSNSPCNREEICPVRMFREEGALLKANPHPHLLPCLEILELPPGFPGLMAGYLSNTWALALEFMEVGSLAHLMHNQLLTPWALAYTNEVALGWTVDVARALAHLHTANPQVLHRDIKQENVMLSKGPGGTGRTIAKLGDLGLHTCPKRLERCKRQRLLRAPRSFSEPGAAPPSTASTRLGTALSSASSFAARPATVRARSPAPHLFFTIREGSFTPRAVNISSFEINKPYELLRPPSPPRVVRQLIKTPPLPLVQPDAAEPSVHMMFAAAAGSRDGCNLGLVSAPALLTRNGSSAQRHALNSGMMLLSPSDAGTCFSAAPTRAASSSSVASSLDLCAVPQSCAEILSIQGDATSMSGDMCVPAGPAVRRTERTVGWMERDQTPQRATARDTTAVQFFNNQGQGGSCAEATVAAAGAAAASASGVAASACRPHDGGAAAAADEDNSRRRAAPQGHTAPVNARRPAPLELALLQDPSTPVANSTSLASPIVASPAKAIRPRSTSVPNSAAMAAPPPMRLGSTGRAQTASGPGAGMAPWSAPGYARHRPVTALPPNIAETESVRAGTLFEALMATDYGATADATAAAATADRWRPGSAHEADGGAEPSDRPAPRVEEMSEVYRLTGETGSSMYIAPEVFKNEPYNDRADVFSFGVLTYEIWCRTLLSASHVGTKRAELDRMILTSDEYARAVAGGYRPERMSLIPDAIWDLITACWDQDPVARPSMVQVRDRLEAILAEVEAGNYGIIGAGSGAPGGGSGQQACACVIS